ncbi:MAG: 30S ribosomal protein S12 methylthiotransferase RimO, partial [bacterium]
MRRNITIAQTRTLLDQLRTLVPGIALRTTFISGFPGESEDDHKQLLEFVAEQAFENLGVFEYSMEPGTVAGTMEQDKALAVPAEIKARRREEVMQLQQQIALKRQEARAAKFDEKNPLGTGLRLDVLIDAPLRAHGRATPGVGAGGGLYSGRTYAQAPQIDSVTFVQSKKPLAPGEVVRCVVVAADGYDLVAKPAEELDRRVSLKVMK